MHDLAIRLCRLTDDTPWEFSRYAAIAKTMQELVKYCAVCDCQLEKYHALLFEVARKFAHESRHETALRYIREAEANAIQGPANPVRETGQ